MKPKGIFKSYNKEIKKTCYIVRNPQDHSDEFIEKYYNVDKDGYYVKNNVPFPKTNPYENLGFWMPDGTTCKIEKL